MATASLTLNAPRVARNTANWHFIGFLFFVTVLAGQFGLDRIDPKYEDLGLLGQVRHWLFFFLLVTMLASGWKLFLGPKVDAKTRGYCQRVAVLHLYLAFTVFWTPHVTEYLRPISAADQVSAVLMLAVLVYLVPALFHPAPRQRFHFLLKLLYGTAIIYAMAGLTGRWSDAGRMYAFGGGPNVFVRVVGMGIFAALFFSLTTKQPKWLLPIPLLAGAAILSGSRGGMFGLAGSLPVYFLLNLREWRIRRQDLVILTVVIIALAPFLASQVLPFWQQRFVAQTFEDRYDAQRLFFFASAVETFRDHPVWGIGLEGFRHTNELQEYVHNLILQIAVEGGLVGLVLLFAALLPVARAWSWSSSPEMRLAFSMGLFIFLAGMFSGSYYDARYMWIFFAIYLLLKFARGAPVKAN
jgi:O-antigen ligase